MSESNNNSQDKLNNYINSYVDDFDLAQVSENFNSTIDSIPATSSVLNFEPNHNYSGTLTGSTITINAAQNLTSNFGCANVLLDVPSATTINYGSNIRRDKDIVKGAVNRLRLEWWGNEVKLFVVCSFFFKFRLRFPPCRWRRRWRYHYVYLADYAPSIVIHAYDNSGKSMSKYSGYYKEYNGEFTKYYDLGMNAAQNGIILQRGGAIDPLEDPETGEPIYYNTPDGWVNGIVEVGWWLLNASNYEDTVYFSEKYESPVEYDEATNTYSYNLSGVMPWRTDEVGGTHDLLDGPPGSSSSHKIGWCHLSYGYIGYERCSYHGRYCSAVSKKPVFAYGNPRWYSWSTYSYYYWW